MKALFQDLGTMVKGKNQMRPRIHHTCTLQSIYMVTLFNLRSGKFIFIAPCKSIKLLVGFYVDGELEGEGRITHEDGGAEEVQFRRGCVHGLARRLDPRGEVVWVGNYHLGQQSGVSWAFPGGGGILITGL